MYKVENTKAGYRGIIGKAIEALYAAMNDPVEIDCATINAAQSMRQVVYRARRLLEDSAEKLGLREEHLTVLSSIGIHTVKALDGKWTVRLEAGTRRGRAVDIAMRVSQEMGAVIDQPRMMREEATKEISAAEIQESMMRMVERMREMGGDDAEPSAPTPEPPEERVTPFYKHGE